MARQSKIADIAQAERPPLLVVDGDSFAHRAYHGLPKTIRRRGGEGGGALVGFANTLIRLHEEERPRAVLVGARQSGPGAQARVGRRGPLGPRRTRCKRPRAGLDRVR